MVDKALLFGQAKKKEHMSQDYVLLDSGNGKKLEQFGKYTLIRPANQAIWKLHQPALWEKSAAEFIRQGKETGTWKDGNGVLPKQWTLQHDGLHYTIQPNEFGNVGLFPEHWQHQEWIKEKIGKAKGLNILNLFSYTGSNSIFLVKQGHKLVQVDSSRQSMDILNKNLEINGLTGQCRLILDDVLKFLQREVKRGSKYDAIILDPPTYGRGKNGEIFKIEKDLPNLLELVAALLAPEFKFVLFTCHTPGYTPLVLKNTFRGYFRGNMETGEVEVEDLYGKYLPGGTYLRLSQKNSYK
ncbi:MAG: class I SAM-dependent methyltransferase [Patescibacteria group bacterium]